MSHRNTYSGVVKKTTGEQFQFSPGYRYAVLGLYNGCDAPIFHEPIVDKLFARGVPLFNRVYLKMQIGVNTFLQKIAIIRSYFWFSASNAPICLGTLFEDSE